MKNEPSWLTNTAAVLGMVALIAIILMVAISMAGSR